MDKPFLCALWKLIFKSDFEIRVESETYISICEYIEGNKLLYYGSCYLIYLITFLLYYKAIGDVRRSGFPKNVLFVIINITIFVLKIAFGKYIYVVLAFDFLALVAIPSLLMKARVSTCILWCLKYLLLIALLAFIKNIEFSSKLSDNIIIGFIFEIDKILVLCLYWLYSIQEKGGLQENGSMFEGLLSSEKTQRKDFSDLKMKASSIIGKFKCEKKEKPLIKKN